VKRTSREIRLSLYSAALPVVTPTTSPYLWPPNASATPMLGISPRTSSGHATWAHPPDRVGVPAGVWADVVPVDVGIPRQARSTQCQPTEGLVGAGDPGVNLTTGSTYALGVDPFARRRDRVLHLITMPDQVSRNVSELVDWEWNPGAVCSALAR
jgi:hypothetical protein